MSGRAIVETRPLRLGPARLEEIPGAVRTVLCRRFLAHVEPEGAIDTPFVADWLQASVTVTAPAAGRFTLSLPVALARELTAAFLGRWRDDDVPDEQAEELTGALALMVCGAWLTKAGPSSCVELSQVTTRRLEQPIRGMGGLKFIVNAQPLTIDVTALPPVHLIERDGRREPLRNAPGSAASAGRWRLLLVEDDPMVRDLMRMMLTAAGYDILEAATGQDALRVAAATQSIDLLVTDIGLPDMNGRHLANQLRAALPGLRTLYVSGAPCEEELSGGERAMQKPFTRSELTAQLDGLIADVPAEPAA